MIQIIPAIDIMDGRCVRLTKGDYGSRKTYDNSPLDMALQYEDCGIKRIHLVDLDGAKAGRPMNQRTLETIASKTSLELEWGGGISSGEALRSIFDAGCNHAIIGSVAALHPQEFENWLQEFGPSRIILGADVRDGKVAVKGWLEDSQTGIRELLDRFCAKGLGETICTDISRDGMLQGPNTKLYTDLQSAYPGTDIIVSGGISNMDDIVSLDECNLRKVIVGKAIYEGRISLKQLKEWLQNE